MTAYKQCLPNANSPGYSFIIYNIFDAILPDDVDSRGRHIRSVMDYSHIPKMTTLTKRNKGWEIICDYLNMHIPYSNRKYN